MATSQHPAMAAAAKADLDQALCDFPHAASLYRQPAASQIAAIKMPRKWR